MKNIFLTLTLFLTISIVFARKNTNFLKTNVQEECSLTASGVVHSSTGDFIATITVKGECDAGLSKKLIKAIAELRAAYK